MSFSDPTTNNNEMSSQEMQEMFSWLNTLSEKEFDKIIKQTEKEIFRDV